MNYRLAAKVEAVNKASKACMELYDLLSPFFAPLINSKILKADSSLLAKYAKILPPLPNPPGINIYRHMTTYSLVWGVSACANVMDSHSIYHEVMCYIGELKGDVLVNRTPRVTHHSSAVIASTQVPPYQA